jgi:glucose-1-phosphate thymidylyltransferase
VIEYEGKWLDPGKFNDWIEANQYLLDTRLNTCIESEISDDSLVENRVCIGQNCQIIKSKIRGPAIIGKNVTIRNSFIGPFTSISDNVEIINSHVENSVVMEGVKIANVESPIDASLIGAHSEVVRSVGPTRTHRFFVGNKCQIQL